MINIIRQFRASGRIAVMEGRVVGAVTRARPRRARGLVEMEVLEDRRLLSTVQTFDGGGTPYAAGQIGGPPPATVTPGGPSGSFMRLATTPTNAIAGNNNSISFATSDPGTFNSVTAQWDFRVTQTIPGQRGTGMSFALLNTTNYGTSGTAASVTPQQGLYDGSFGFGFDTTNNTVYASQNSGIVTAVSVPSGLDLASGQFIHATATIDFQHATVSLTLTPSSTGTAVTIFDAQEIPNLGPYQARVGFQAANTAANYADFDVDNINVQFTGQRLAGTLSFGSVNFVANESDGVAFITINRTGGSSGSVTIGFVSADGTARNGVNYTSVAGAITFAEGVTQQVVAIPLIDDGVADGNKTVNLYLSNPTLTAPLSPPIVSTLTIVNTDPVPPTVSPTVTKVYRAGTRRVAAFRLTFSQPLDRASAQDTSNYELIFPSASRAARTAARGASGSASRAYAFASAVLDPTGTVVTLSRGVLGRMHLPKLVQILVRGTPPAGVRNASGTFLAGTGGVSGTDALLTVRV
ncbi:Calx-beta domain protein [Aquisphaera giovannonii]|uniref:Calx-beta domain protein n=1 Tax=Aquisphaera giovannonii TaxID=406548 RepID=A0A5B9VYN7_9BACT|nr:Calx-beta domain-containing protein [Aquisphaera giovannonii]QEH33418.1 Calx-beta domain protein [Aquisphaera giovannonii]